MGELIDLELLVLQFRIAAGKLRIRAPLISAFTLC